MQPELLGTFGQWLLLAIGLVVVGTVAWMGYEMGREAANKAADMHYPAAQREHQPQASQWLADGDPTVHGRD